MNELTGLSSQENTEVHRSFDFFFDRLDTCLRKGRGFTLFQADERCVSDFAEGCERRGLAPLTIPLSALEEGLARLPGSAPFVVVIQDVSYAEFVEMASMVADRLVFPLWFRRVPICFFSWLDREAYESQPINSEDIHVDVSRVIRALLIEQALTLLERSNYRIDSPEQLEPGAPRIEFTPLEEKIRAALEGHQLPYEPQVRLGRQVVDFLVKVQDKQVAVECESRSFHEQDGHKDQSTTLAGYPLCRLSAAEIEADPEKCIRTIQETIHYRTLPSYAVDDDLDPSQQQAIKSVSGPVRVLAPAGSGKTKTLVNRILYLLNQGVAAERILALAFNKKARDEMQDRLERRGVKDVDVRTFHSFGYEVVREGLGWTFSSSHRKTAKALIRAAIQEHIELPALRNQDPLDAFLGGLRQAKMELQPLSTVTVEYGDKIYPLEPIFYSYLKQQVNASFLDFDDMIYLAVRLLLENRALRCEIQSRFAFILVDEFQDLNETQLLLLQIIGLPENNIFAVGDDDQMIYGFRGADVKHIVEFEKRFPVASTHVLNTNYRSSRMVVRHANWLIGNNRDRVPKEIQPRKDVQPGRFEVAGYPSLLEQARHAARWLAEHKKQNNLNWRDYAVLYRYNAYEYPLALMLDASGIPHSPVATGQLFKSTVGLDVYSYLQVLLFPREAKPADFERILKRPNKFLTNQLIAQAKDWNSFTGLPQLPNLREWERQKLTDFVGLVERSSRLARGQGDSQSGEGAVQSRGAESETARTPSQSEDKRSQVDKTASQSGGDASQAHKGTSQAHWAAASPPQSITSQVQGNPLQPSSGASQSQGKPPQTAADCLQMLKTDFGLTEFYHEQSRISDDLDQASNEGLLDVMIAMAGNYKTPLLFYQFLCKSMADQEADSERDAGNEAGGNGNHEREQARGNEVHLSTIHRAKGREFRNVVYFNFSQSVSDPKQANFIEEERRVAYVGATRPKDDLLITFSAARPSEFLREIALNPKYRGLEEDDLKRGFTSAELRLEKANVVLKQLEARKQKQIASFRELTKTQIDKKRSSWLQSLLNKVQLWRVDRALAKIEVTQEQIKAHKEATIASLEQELHAIEEEQKMRAALVPKEAHGNEVMNKDWKEATKQGDLERVRTLLKSGTDINARDEHGQTALMNAAHAGQVELVRLLVEQGADMNVTAKYNLSALMLALVARQPEIAQLLIKAGADVDIRSTANFSEVSALSLAEKGGLEEIAALLKERGAVS